LLCFPDIGHFEQKSNALRVQELGLGLSLDYGIDSKELAKLIRFCSTDKSINEKSNEFSGLALSYKNNAHFLKLLDAEFC
ncbi:MAG: hypothetical protein QXZ13_03210, partial [Candidatus Diapherotrites archaeon]